MRKGRSDMKTKRNDAMIYTPKMGIPIGKATISTSGDVALAVKKSKSPEVDEIPLEELIRQLITKASDASEKFMDIHY